MAFDINVRSNMQAVERKLSALARQQLPFATANGLTSLARLVQQDETLNLRAKLKNPSPFTLKSIKMAAARKSSPVAKVFMMDKTASYLEPYERGGVHKLNSKALLNPKNISLNQYGQLRRGALAKFKGRADVFIGPVKTKKGIVNGVWQRGARGERRSGYRGTKGRRNKVNGSYTSLKLLIRFGDALPVNKPLGYQARAVKLVNARFNQEMGKALATAIASAR